MPKRIDFNAEMTRNYFDPDSAFRFRMRPAKFQPLATPYPLLTFIELCFLSLFALSVLYSMRLTIASSFEKLFWLFALGLRYF